MIDLVDTHVHLYFDAYDLDRDEVIRRATAAGVRRMIVIGAGGGLESAYRAVALADSYDGIFATVGVHPHDAGKGIDFDAIKSLLAHPKVVAIGEAGLDFYRDWAPVDAQRAVFTRQIETALDLGKPLVVHSRSAGAESLSMIREIGEGKIQGVFHCYSEDAEFARRLAEIGFLVSVTGTVTFKKADAFRAIVREIPLDQLMLETDGPYMAPEPYRGARAESAHVREIAQMVASVKGISLEEVARVTTRNAERLFGLEGRV